VTGDEPVREEPSILLAEDSREERVQLRQLLEGEGLSVVAEAGNGQEALDLVRDLDPDVVLMDLRMPVMNGLEATREILAVAPTTQVLVLTAYDDPFLDRSAIEIGAYAYLVKGCSIQLIRDVVLQAGKYKAGLDAEVRRRRHGG
jgi:DNA-binding NarL/FixJ family response regulator